MDKEECKKRCESLLKKTPNEFDAAGVQGADSKIQAWSAEVVYFLSAVLPKGHLILKHLDRVMKNVLPSVRLIEVRGALEGFNSSLCAGDLEDCFSMPFGDIV